jgi:hypothetical protein
LSEAKLKAISERAAKYFESDFNCAESYQKALELFKRFEKESGSTLCYDLIRLDLTTPEGREKIKASFEPGQGMQPD